MSLFSPRTFSTDWEVMGFDKLDRNLNTEKCDAFAGPLSKELDLPIHIDYNSIEFGLGINTSYKQFLERIIKATDRAAEIVREFDMELFPAAAFPMDGAFYGSHIHVGSIHDEKKGIYLENQLMKYVPAFGALGANSPVWWFCKGEAKSYRVQKLAWHCTVPSSIREPGLSQTTWGNDAAPKIYGVPTLEVRIIDCATSRRLLAELAVFIAAFVHNQGDKVKKYSPDPGEYCDNLTNRWSAARYGMQATFIWDGKERPTVDIIDEMLDDCKDGLAKLGAKRDDLILINQMIKKRICQADYVIDLADRYPDPIILTSVYSKLIRHWEIIDEYFGKAKPLEPVPVPDEKKILEEHLSCIGDGTYFFRLRDVMYYPSTITDEMLEKMIRNGYVSKEVTDTHGTLLYRKK